MKSVISSHWACPCRQEVGHQHRLLGDSTLMKWVDMQMREMASCSWRAPNSLRFRGSIDDKTLMIKCRQDVLTTMQKGKEARFRSSAVIKARRAVAASGSGSSGEAGRFRTVRNHQLLQRITPKRSGRLPSSTITVLPSLS